MINSKLPLIFQSRFVKTVQVYSHETRSNKKSIFFPLVTKSGSQNSLTFRGTKMWKEINKDLRHKNVNHLQKAIQTNFA